jgi:uncharacterized protein
MSDTQDEVIAWLLRPGTHGGETVDRIDTHISVVVLAGARVFKLKRAVRFDYLDFSTPDLRRQACDTELRLNRRTAPALYRRVVAVTREADGTLALDGTGPPVDWLVEMARFDQEALFDRLAASGALDEPLMDRLAHAVARLHAVAEVRTDHGGAAGTRWVVDGNADAFRMFTDTLDPDEAARLTADARAELDRQADRLDTRRRQGFVRWCHGDLHLRNIVLLDGAPTLFDCIEFNDAIACIDVFYDLAFLLMDLWRRQLRPQANAVLNGYLAETGDLDGLALLPLFLSCRAAIRAKTSATAAGVQPDTGRARELRALAQDYLRMARGLLRPAPARLVAVGGFSGTGKSTLARALAPTLGAVPGAVVLRSDEIRKAIAGVPATHRLGPDAYTPAMHDRVYDELGQRAVRALTAGHAVLLDAVHGDPADRDRAEGLARTTGVPFDGLWLEAPEAVLTARVRGRHGDASDADAGVVRLQQRHDPGTIRWHRLDASGSLDAMLARTDALLGATAAP